MHFFHSFTGLLASGLLITGMGLSPESSAKNLSEQALQDAYSAHLRRVQKMLPPHSGLPPLLDLSKPKIQESTKDYAWEQKFNGLMNSRIIVDPGTPRLSEATSVATTFIDSAGRPPALPVQSCDAVFIATAVASRVCMARTRTYVYSRFSLQVSQVFKRNKKADIQEGAKIVAVQLGGRIRFSSGHMETFILANHGFFEVGQQYLVFIWKPATSIATYIAAETYLIRDDRVFSIHDVADTSAYDGMQLNDFEAKIKELIAKNANSN